MLEKMELSAGHTVVCMRIKEGETEVVKEVAVPRVLSLEDIRTLLREMMGEPDPVCEVPPAQSTEDEWDDDDADPEDVEQDDPERKVMVDLDPEDDLAEAIEFCREVCRVCGCTSERACKGGCTWVDRDHTICCRCYLAMCCDQQQNPSDGAKCISCGGVGPASRAGWHYIGDDLPLCPECFAVLKTSWPRQR